MEESTNASRTAEISLALFQKFQPRVRHFLDAMKFGTPKFTYAIKPLINAIETLADGSEFFIHAIEFCLDPQNRQAYNRAVEGHRCCNGDDLFSGHGVLPDCMTLCAAVTNRSGFERPAPSTHQSAPRRTLPKAEPSSGEFANMVQRTGYPATIQLEYKQ